jgi:hypothetical protein
MHSVLSKRCAYYKNDYNIYQSVACVGPVVLSVLRTARIKLRTFKGVQFEKNK